MIKMTIDQINDLLVSESGVLLLRKKSEESFFEFVLANSTSLLGLAYFLSRKKFDSLIVSKKRLLFILKNKVNREYLFNNINSIAYNSKASRLIILDDNQEVIISLAKLRVTYEESKSLRGLLVKFMNEVKPLSSN